MKMQVVYVPIPNEANGQSQKTYDLNAGEPLPSIGEQISFDNTEVIYRIVSKKFHYVGDDMLQVFFSFKLG